MGADVDTQNASSQSFDIVIGAFPDIVTLTPRPKSENVPTEIYLELGFSQPMDTTSVQNSTLTLSEITAFSDAGGTVVSNTQFDLVLSSNWISREWHDTPRGADTLLKVTATTNSPPAGAASFSLTANRYYRVQMSVNQARSKDTGSDLPLFIGGGPGEFDLLSGFEFKTIDTTTPAAIGYQYPEIVSITPAPDADNVPIEVYLELGF